MVESSEDDWTGCISERSLDTAGIAPHEMVDSQLGSQTRTSSRKGRGHVERQSSYTTDNEVATFGHESLAKVTVSGQLAQPPR